MPSGQTHDFITILLAAPTAAATYHFTRDWTLTAIVTGAMIFGGLMFGPDLDTQSRPYTRWGPLRLLWWPYKVALPHRSRWSHGIILGTLVRVVYFSLIVALAVALALYVRDAYIYRAPTSLNQLGEGFTRIWELVAPINPLYLLATFVGLWVGASSHTVTDVLGSFFKSVRKSI